MAQKKVSKKTKWVVKNMIIRLLKTQFDRDVRIDKVLFVVV